MFGTISESEMRRRTENVGLSVQSVRLEGGDVYFVKSVFRV